MEAVQLGPVLVNWSLLSLLLSAAAGYMAAFVIMRWSGRKDSSLLDVLLNGMIFGLLAWKLTPLLTQPKLLWQAPLKAVMMPSGETGIWIGCIVAGIYTLVRAFRGGISLRLLVDLLAYGTIVSLAVRSLLNGWQYGAQTDLPWGISLHDPAYAYHPLNVYQLLFAAMFALIFLFRRMKPGEGWAGKVLLWLGGAGGFALTMVGAGESVSFIFTNRQWLCLLAMAVGLILPRLYILWESQLERSLLSHGKNGFESAEKASEGEQAARKESDNERQL